MQKKRSCFLIFVALVLVVGMAACSGGGKISAGRWEGTAEFGTFAFIVNSDSTVTYLEYDVPECGNYSMSGVFEGAWKGFAITNGAFTYGPDDTGFTLSGEFDASGKSASGDWRFSPSDCTLSDPWEAVPVP